MQPKRLAVLGATLIVLFAAPVLAMDCKRASTRVEELICADPALVAADRTLNEAYQADLSSHADSKTITDDQRYWIKATRDTCADVACLEGAYRQRLAAIRSTVDCIRPATELDAQVCSAKTEDALGQLVVARLNAWRPYLAALNDMPRDPAQAAQKWDAIVTANRGAPGPHCRTFDCRRAETVRRLEEVTFPQEIHEAFLAWIRDNGARSPFLDPDRWMLDDSEAEPLWKLSDQRIIAIGDLPEWLRKDQPGSFGVPATRPPFLDRKLTGDEAFNLRWMVTALNQDSRYDDGPIADESIAGVSVATMTSVRVDDGGSAKCSPNPILSDLWIGMPFPPRSASASDGKAYKLIELLERPVEAPVVSCAFDEQAPGQDFYDGRKSDIAVDRISSAPFVRPDGTFWLKLTEGRWFRFRRDMSSEAKDRAQFAVLSSDEFQKLVDQSKTMSQLDTALRRRFPPSRTQGSDRSATGRP